MWRPNYFVRYMEKMFEDIFEVDAGKGLPKPVTTRPVKL